ncbi:GNAT family N-acetyltransferase [Streptomyces seoulensis]|uniref:GNAT family N-acetyltransferase n=1 Tax=Streptomyces seoulensis TaxID=73044 RepID=UPI003C2F4C7B
MAGTDPVPGRQRAAHETRSGRGYARACVDGLLDWFRVRGARQIQLTASADARPMYEALGFKPKPDPLMELTW